MIYITKSTSIEDILKIVEDYPIELRIESNGPSLRVYAKESGYVNNNWKLLKIKNCHYDLTTSTANSIGVNVSEFLNWVESKKKFNKINDLIHDNNIPIEDVENYMRHLSES